MPYRNFFALFLGSIVIWSGIFDMKIDASETIDPVFENGAHEISFDIWDWTPPWRDLSTFEIWIEDLAKMGITRIEMGVPWNIVEPEKGIYNFEPIAQRVEICKRFGLGVRFRINTYYGGATPQWYDGDVWKDIEGHDVQQRPPSIADERFWANYGPMCTALASRFKDEDIYFNAFIGIHAELKYADWWTFDESSLRRWREAISNRPQWLKQALGPDVNIDLPERPCIPPFTNGTPDLEPASRAFIAFREQLWREAVNRFCAAIQSGDPNAKISAPLGESFRRESAHMSNQDYFGLSKGADQVVHSYDFFWHKRQPAWYAQASAAAFQGITSKPVCFEFDGPVLWSELGYTKAELASIAQAHARTGAGLKFANYSYFEQLPSTMPILGDLIEIWKREYRPKPKPQPDSKTILLFVSKWTNYLYRENTEWVHDAQFGIFGLLNSMNEPVRIICEDNLDEPLEGYRALVIAFSPQETIPLEAINKLNALNLPTVIDVPYAPKPYRLDEPLIADGELGAIHVIPQKAPVGICELHEDGNAALMAKQSKLAIANGHKVILGYPIGYAWCHGPEPDLHVGVMAWALARAQSAFQEKEN